MGNFMRRTLAFFLGMIFAFVLMVGALVGGGYWAFKNLTPNHVGVGEETLGGLSSMSFEEWTAFIVEIQKDPQGFTVKELEKKGIKTNNVIENNEQTLSEVERILIDIDVNRLTPIDAFNILIDLKKKAGE